MPNREIKESCRHSPTLTQLSDFAERFFWRLTTVADDYGRFPADPRYMRAECFPLFETIKTAKVAAAFAELEAAGLVESYQNWDRTYGQFKTWEKHQRCRAKFSKYPPPASDGSCRQPLASAADLRSTKDPDLRSTKISLSVTQPVTASGNGYSRGFERFWKAYPNSEGTRKEKGEAFKIWKAMKLEERADEIYAAIRKQDEEDSWFQKDGKRCIPYPARWLKKCRFDDDQVLPDAS